MSERRHDMIRFHVIHIPCFVKDYKSLLFQIPPSIAPSVESYKLMPVLDLLRTNM